MEFFEKNLGLLRGIDPGLAQRVSAQPLSENIKVVKSKSGFAIPQLNSISLHSVYRPVEEAEKLTVGFSLVANQPTVVSGLGFGYHILEILKKTEGKVYVVEPLMSLFRAFISEVDLSHFLPRVVFHIAEEPARVLNNVPGRPWNNYVHKASFRFSEKYFQLLDKASETKEFLKESSLKVLVVNPIYGGSLPTAKFCASALKNLGHEVVSVNCEEYAEAFFATKNITKNSKNSEVLSKLFMNFMNEVIVAKAADFRPDLILALAQAPLSPEGISRLKLMGAPVAFWFVEDFRTLGYWEHVASCYDHFFTIQRGSFFEELEKGGIKNYYYLPQACSPSVHKPLDLDSGEKQKYKADLSFMGAAYYNRKQCFPRLLDFDFKIWGTEWDLGTAVGKRVQNKNERVSTEDCVKIYNTGKINLNLHSSTFHQDVNPNGDFVNPRTFEIAACGAFQLVDERSELSSLFKPGEEIVTFKDIDDLKNKIAYFLDRKEEREAIAVRARIKAISDHSFERRLEEMLVHIFQSNLKLLENKLDKRGSNVGFLIEQAGEKSDLGTYLKSFDSQRDLALKDVVKRIESEEGDLTQNELLLLMVDQVVKEDIS
jgi:spore maturation protein CgeB